MKTGEAAFLAVSIGITGAGVLATARASGVRKPRTPSARWVAVTDGLRAGLGRVGAFYAIVLASVLPLILWTWWLGSLTRHKPLSTLNERVLHAYDSGVSPWLTPAMKLLTQMGNWYQVVTVALVASAVLAALTRGRRWVPPLIIITTLLGERYIQKAITEIVKVHHPPTDLGTYPSGGVARLVCIFGVVGFVALRLFWPRSRRLWTGGIWLLVLLTWIESYSRIHLQKHWFFDAIGGLLLGGAILAVAIVASSVLPWPDHAGDEPRARHRGRRYRRPSSLPRQQHAADPRNGSRRRHVAPGKDPIVISRRVRPVAGQPASMGSSSSAIPRRSTARILLTASSAATL